MKQALIIGGDDPFCRSLATSLPQTTGLSVEAVRPGDALSLADVVIYAAASAGDSNQPNTSVNQSVFTAVRNAGIKHLVVLCSSAIHRPRHGHPGLVAEVRPARCGKSDLCDPWLELETSASEAMADGETRLSLLRTAPVPVKGGRDFFSRLMTGFLSPTLAGHDPTIQLLAMDDLAAAIAAVVEKQATGLFNVAPKKPIPLRKALKLAGVLNLKLPRLAQVAARACFSSMGLSASPRYLEQIRYNFTISGDKMASELAFQASYSSGQVAASLKGGAIDRELDESDYDEYGFEKGYTNLMRSTLFGFLHNIFWRVENSGAERVPKQGKAILVGVHRGFMPFDGTMALYEMVRKLGRYPRTLIHPCLIKPAFLADYIRRIGGVVACRENADKTLEQDGLLNIFPEGINGAFTLYKDAYKLGNFGRDEFVKIALRNQAPLCPFVTVGSAEIYPIFGRINIGWLTRHTEWPFLPITTPMPLPSKWHTHYLQPIPIAGKYPPEAADDPLIVRQIGDEVRARMEEALAVMLEKRKSIFFGDIFSTKETAQLAES